MTFEDLGLSPKVVAAVDACGYKDPTPIQAQAIPHVLARRDLIGIAQTGTGKTASFVLPMLTSLESGRARARMPRTLILEPTRELAAQVEDSFTRYGVNHKLTVALLIGGVSFDDQFRKLDRGADVLIATPGRLLDHFERGKLLLSSVGILVIDEADRMLDMGFIPDIERICKLLPFTRQTLFFSATMPGEIKKLTERFLSNPVQLEAAPPATTAENVALQLVRCSREPFEKRAMLRALIKQAEGLTNAIVFCNRKRDVAVVQRSMERHGFNVGALHGDMDQRARMRTLDDFRNNRLTYLVASDVAARGLDITAVSHIYNFDVPTHAEDYVHRIGRTGRAGRSGTAITIVTDLERKYISAIEKLIGRQLEVLDIDADDERSRAARGRGKPAPKHRDARRENVDKVAKKAQHVVSEKTVAKAPDEPSAKPVAKPVAKPADEAPATKPVAPAEPVAKSPEERPSRADANEPSRRGKRSKKGEAGRRQSDDGKPVIGLGDHVPQFLLRPVRLKEAAD
ncbi:MAG: DEAD/DEAH box helicase [Alphaproteobacteria bacterium]